MNYLRECLYDVEWQKLRVKCLGKWQNEKGVGQCMSTLWLYWSRNEAGKPERVWRTLNLLNAVKLGWAQTGGTPSDKALEMVDNGAKKLSVLHTRYAQGADPEYQMGTEWDWNKVREQLMMSDKFVLKQIQDNLRRRAAHAKRRFDGDESKVRENRPELVFFLELLDMEMDRREGRSVRCLAKIFEKKSPYMQEFRGYRICTTMPNMAGHKPFSGEACPSFLRPWLLVTFGDFEDDDALGAAVEKVAPEMKRRGFDQVEWLE